MPDSTTHPAGQPRAGVRPRISWWKHLLQVVLNLALLALLALQLFLLVILSTHRHLTLPGFVQAAIERRLGEQGLSVRFFQLEATISGRLLLREPKVFLDGSADPVVEADYLYLEPDWFGLLWSGRFRFSELRLVKGSLFCPPEVSASGAREPLLSDVHVSLKSQGERWWQLEHLRAHVFNVALIAHGTFQLPPMATVSATPAPSLATSYRQWAREATRLQRYFEAVKEPALDVALDTPAPGVMRAQARASLASARWPDAGATLGGARTELSATWNGERLHVLGPVELKVDQVGFMSTTAGQPAREIFSGGPVWVRAGFAEGSRGILNGKIAQVSLLSGPASLGGYPSGSLAVEADARNWPVLPVTVFATQGPDWLRLRTRADNFQIGGQVDFQIHARLADVLAEAKVQLPERLDSLKFDRALSLGGTVALDGNHEPVFIDFNLETGGAHFDRINLYALQTSGRLGFAAGQGGVAFLSQLDFQSISLWNDTWQVEGSYFQDLTSDDFRLFARGSVDPRVLDEYIGHWWPSVWEFVVPGKEWPHADIEYSGNWGWPSPENPIFGSVSLMGASARGVPMDSIGLRIFQRRDVVAVYDLLGHAASGGELSGAMYWLMKPPYVHTYEQRYIFDSTLPLLEAATLAGPQTVELVQPVDSPTAPTVHVDQRTGGSVNPQPHVVATHLTAKVAAPLHAFHVPLDSVDAEATIYDGFTDIPRFDFGIAGGQARASATLTTLAPHEDELAFKVTVQGTHHSAFIHALGQFHAGNDTAAPANVTANNTSLIGDPSHKGLLDLALGGKLILGQPDTFVAGGRARVYDADLGQIHLFGGLTRVLADAGLSFGSFDLDKAESELQIAHQYMRTPHLVITGPSARIVAAGLFHFGDNRVNYNALIFPLGEITMPGVAQIARLFDPLSNIVTLTLTGDADHPDWHAGMHLLRMFESQTVTGPPIPDYPANPDGSPQTPPFPAPPPLPAAAAPKPAAPAAPSAPADQ